MNLEKRLVAPLAALVLLGGALLGGRLLQSDRADEPPLSSPLRVSNATAYPVTIYGPDVGEDAKLRIGAIEVSAERIDRRHFSAVVPAGLPVPPAASRAKLEARLHGSSGQGPPLELEVVNDLGFPEPIALLVTGDDRPLIADQTGDRLWVAPSDTLAARSIPVGDGPRALARWIDPSGRAFWIVVQENAAELLLLPEVGSSTAARAIAVDRGGQAIAVDSGRGYLTNRIKDAIEVIDLIKGAVIGEIRCGVNPRAIALGGGLLWVSHLGSEDLWRIDPAAPDRQPLIVEIGPGAKIIGGHTAKYAGSVIGGKPARALVWSERLRTLFAATIGPNIGPNADRMEVTPNGGITVVAQGGQFLRHVSLVRGIPQDLALDDARGLLFAADVATGRVVVLDAVALAADDAAASRAILGELAIDPPPDTPLIRPAEDFANSGRSGRSLHSGPWALALSGERLFVLCRFTGEVVELDVSAAREGKLTLTRRFPPLPMGEQKNRRLGEILFFTDLGNSRMTCDACHPDGADGGVLFTKSKPIQIYRSPSIRSAHASAPYFTPAALSSLAAMSKVVLARNRFRNPLPTKDEIRALTEYSLALSPPPNPFRGKNGALPRELVLPDGRHGDAVKGLELFEGDAGCTGCHPPPHFTLDQDDKTRGRLFDVGTPLMLPLRLEQQDQREQGVPPPSLVGVWDNYPLLYSGAGGFGVSGAVLRADAPFALRRVLELRGAKPHGRARELAPSELDDLLAYLLTL